jgi:hypothetical protein
MFQPGENEGFTAACDFAFAICDTQLGRFEEGSAFQSDPKRSLYFVDCAFCEIAKRRERQEAGASHQQDASPRTITFANRIYAPRTRFL